MGGLSARGYQVTKFLLLLEINRFFRQEVRCFIFFIAAMPWKDKALQTGCIYRLLQSSLR